LVDIGVPYLDVLEAFEKHILLDGNMIASAQGASYHLGNINSIVDFIQSWIYAARSDHGGMAKKQLLQATVWSPWLISKLATIKTQVVAMIPQDIPLLEQIERMEDEARHFSG
jgi:hypothetical protein